MHGEDRPNIKTQLIIGALKFAEFPDHISIDYDLLKKKGGMAGPAIPPFFLTKTVYLLNFKMHNRLS